MTEAQIEAIARLYCQKLGLDPDEVKGTSGWPRWKFYVENTRSAVSAPMREAIADVLGEKVADPIHERQT